MKKTAVAILAGIALCLFYLAAPATAPAQNPHGNGVDCKQCHSCSKPTKANPCLKMCPRPTAPVQGQKNAGPDIVILNELEDLYVPVRFDHRKHAGMSGMAKGCDGVPSLHTGQHRAPHLQELPPGGHHPRGHLAAGAQGRLPPAVPELPQRVGSATPSARSATRRRPEDGSKAPPPTSANTATTSRCRSTN